MAVKFQGGRAVPVSAIAISAVETLLSKVRDQGKKMYREKTDANGQEAEGWASTKFYYITQAKKTGNIEELRLAFAGGTTGLLGLIQQVATLRNFARQRGLGPAADAEWAKLQQLLDELKSAVIRAGVVLNR